MAYITGPMVDEAVEELHKWYLDTAAALMDALSEGYPYGSVPLSPSEQVARFVSMTPEDWKSLIAKLVERYRGQPNAEELARSDLKDYVSKMNRMAFGGQPNANT